tara:strand:- start:2219 stop:2614 length:396 start_codon:yes stop_codon:yes gene_type:complete
MGTLAINKIIEGGLAEDLENAASSGDEFANSGIEFIHVVNDHASESYTVSVTAQKTTMRHPSFGSLTKANQTFVVAAGAEAFAGPFRQTAFNDSGNKAQITYTCTDDGAALSTISSGAHALKIEVLYLDQQ